MGSTFSPATAPHVQAFSLLDMTLLMLDKKTSHNEKKKKRKKKQEKYLQWKKEHAKKQNEAMPQTGRWTGKRGDKWLNMQTTMATCKTIYRLTFDLPATLFCNKTSVSDIENEPWLCHRANEKADVNCNTCISHGISA